MKKERKKILTTSFLMLIVASIAMASTTYAWFFSNGQSKVSSINSSTMSAEGFKISVDGVNWYDSLNWEDDDDDANNDILSAVKSLSSSGEAQYGSAYGYNNLGVMYPITSSGQLYTTYSYDDNGNMQLTFLGLNFYCPKDNFTTMYNLGGSIDGKVYGVFKFNLYFKNTSSSACKLVFDLSSPVMSNNDKNATNQDVENSVRFAFIPSSCVNSEATSAELIASLPSVSSSYYINTLWEPNASKHNDDVCQNSYAPNTSQQSLLNGTLYYACTSTVQNGEVYSYMAPVRDSNIGTTLTTSGSKYGTEHPVLYNGKICYGFKNGSTTSYTYNDYTDWLKIMSTVNSSSGFMDLASNIPANGGCVKVIVYAWIEGQDVDCIDSQAGGSMVANLKFFKQ